MKRWLNILEVVVYLKRYIVRKRGISQDEMFFWGRDSDPNQLFIGL